MNDLSDQMERWLNKVSKLVPSTAQKQLMTNAGAKVGSEVLAKQTKSKHYDNKRINGVKHLADSIDVNELSGASVYGFTGKNGINHGRIARFLNDGTKKIVPDHFVDESRRIAKPLVFEAEYEVYKKIKGGK